MVAGRGAPPARPAVPAAQLSPEEMRKQRLKQKLHSWIYDLSIRIPLGDFRMTPNDALFVHDGIAEIRVELTSVTPEVIDKLRSTGFEVVTEGRTYVTGRLAIERLAALAEFDEVKLVAPQL